MERLISGSLRLGIELTSQQVNQFERYYRELVDWNKRMNLTRITDYEEVQTKHFLDSLTLVKVLKQPDSDFKLIDVGSGAGIPGIPLKILFPQIRLVLLDSAAKKAKFLYHVIQELGLAGVEIVVGRAEEVAHREEYRDRFPLVVSRGVAPLVTLVELTLPFCLTGGKFVAQKKGAIEEEVSNAGRAITVLGGRLREVEEIDLPELPDKRYLVIIDKIAPTPEKYPRRPGMPAKRPIK